MKILKPVVMGLTYLVLATGCSSDYHKVNRRQNLPYHSLERNIQIRNNRTRLFLQTSAGMKEGTVHTRRSANGYVVIEGDGSSIKSRNYRKACHQADTNGDGWVSPSEAKKYYRNTIENRLR